MEWDNCRSIFRANEEVWLFQKNLYENGELRVKTRDRSDPGASAKEGGLHVRRPQRNLEVSQEGLPTSGQTFEGRK